MKCTMILLALVAMAWPGVSMRAGEDKPAQDWPQWRGPNRDGVAPAGPKLLDAWPTNGPVRVWKSDYIPSFDLGGSGSPVVADGKVFLCVSWYHPVGGGREMKPITQQLLTDWGWLPDIPADLAKKIEDARVSTNRPNFRDSPDWVMAGTNEQDVAIQAFLAKHATMETYIKDFLATLDPKVAASYGNYIKRRICPNQAGPGDAPFTWDQLVKMRDQGLNKGYRTYGEFVRGFVRHGEEYGVWKAAWRRATASWTDTLVCLDAATGKLLWKAEFPATIYDVGWGISPSGTPTVSDGKCYFSGTMGTYCVSTRDGALVWKAKGGSTHSSPLVFNGVVVSGWPLTAWDAETGKQVWYTGDPRAGGTPVLWVSGGKTNMIAGGSWGKQFYCIDPDTWKILWEIKGGNPAQSTPIIIGDIMIAGGDVGMQAYKLSLTGAERLWKNPRQDGISSPVVVQDAVYLNDSNHKRAGWHCQDLKTGALKWSQESPFGCNVCSSPIVADGKIIMPLGPSTNANGSFEIEMLKPDSAKFLRLGSFNAEATPCASPAFAGGKLYLRVWDGVACYDLRAP